MVQNNDDSSSSNRDNEGSGLATSDSEEVVEDILEQMEERGIDLSSLGEAYTSIDEEQNDVGRGRGIITPEDRRFLLGEKEYRHETTLLNTKRRIRDRVKNGILDLTYVLLMDEDELVKVFDSIPDSDLYFSLSEFIGIIYTGLNSNEDELENIIESGIYHAEQENETETQVKDIDVSIKIKRDPNIRGLLEKHRKDLELTNGELGLLVREGVLRPSDFQKYATE